MRGRSAFSVYSEEKTHEGNDHLKSAHNGKRSLGNDRRVVKTDILAPSTSRNAKIRTEKMKLKKQKNKFSKLSTDEIRHTIGLFNGKKSNIHQNQKSGEFRVITSKADSEQRAKKLPSENGKATGNGKKESVKIVKTAEKRKPKEIKTKKKQKSARLSDEANDDELANADSHEFMFDSRKEAIKLLNKIISPIKHKEFFSQYWEKKPLLIQRNGENYYHDWFSCKEFDNIMRNHNLDFTQNIDVTTYINGVKQKHNPEGRAFAPRVWDFFQQGCSIRLLNPATYSQNLWKYLSLLQEFFGSCVGSNVYLTPKGTQGFAPHYDDIEAFVLQLEGRKRWRVYAPLSDDTTLPRYSSENFSQSDLPEPLLDVILEQGDLLYFPRGFVHQANAVDDIHSLHITVSCYQLNSWGDFLTKLLPGAIENAMMEDVEFRRGLPISYLEHNGIAYSDNKETKERTEFRKKTVELFKKLIKHLPIDAGVDQLAKRFIHESLPPCLTEYEKGHSIHGHGETWNPNKNRVENISEIGPETSIKLIRKNCLRLVMENESILVYHNLENTKIYCEKDPVPLEIEVEAAPAIEALIHAYPKYIRVDELPIETLEERITVAQCLYDKGLLISGEPLECDHEDFSDDGQDENGQDNGSEDEDEEGEEEEDADDDFNSVDYDNFSNQEEMKSDSDGDDDDEEDEDEEETNELDEEDSETEGTDDE